jgi:RecA-family ATPase
MSNDATTWDDARRFELERSGATPFAWRPRAEIPPRGHDVPLDALDGDVPPSGPTPNYRLEGSVHGAPFSINICANDRRDAQHAAVGILNGVMGTAFESWFDLLHGCDEDTGIRTLFDSRTGQPIADARAYELPLIDTAAWAGRNPPERRWIVDGWLARGTGALFIGEDGVGKSLLGQQLVTAVAAGRPFLGVDVVQVPALYLTCEDDAAELWRRQLSVNAMLQLPADAAPAFLASLAGVTDTMLGTFDADGRFSVSPMFLAIEALGKARGLGLIVLDNVAHLYAGNENVRREVAAFCSALDRLAIATDSTVMAIGHPNKAGAEYSGSTGWSAHVRQRWFMERPADSAGDRDARVLRKSKANYSESGTQIPFRWHRWAFVCPDDLPGEQAAELAAVTAASADNLAFLACLAERTKQQRAVSESVSSTYAPKVFAGMPQAKGAGQKRMQAAMDRLFAIGKIERATLPWTRDRKAVEGLREVPG